MMSALSFIKSHFQDQAPPPIVGQPSQRPGSMRQNSWDSNASTLIDLATANDVTRRRSTDDTSAMRQHGTDNAVAGLPSQQKAAPQPPGCQPCSYFPEGKDYWKKMKRHRSTHNHSKKTGERNALPGYRCALCGSTFNRKDNLQQHRKKQHEEQRTAAGRGASRVQKSPPRAPAGGGRRGAAPTAT